MAKILERSMPVPDMRLVSAAGSQSQRFQRTA
jgi:hypothetical protein